jgi:predicted 3-demethylubiquinone-9 3-methyltransferase (glyoxalase superfamily)
VSVRLAPFLWYSDQAEEAARFYASIIPDSRVDSVVTMPADSPSGPAGSVVVVEFTLAGRDVMAMSAGPMDPFNNAISIMLECDTQAEIDRLWDGLLRGGGKPQACGWLQDRYGLRWQVAPRVLQDMMKSSDRVAGRRAAEAMMTMIKLDIAQLEAAFRG